MAEHWRADVGDGGPRRRKVRSADVGNFIGLGG